MRPTWRVLGAGALWAVLEWYGATSEVPWLFLLAAWILATLAATAAYSAWNRSGLKLHLAVRSSRPGPGSPADELPDAVLRLGPYPAPLFEGDAVELEVGLDTSGAARGPAWVQGRLGSQTMAFGTGLVGRQGWRQATMLGDTRRGPLGATGWSIGTSDPLGFFEGRRGCPDAEVALVLPRFMSLAGRARPRELEAGVAAPRAGSGNELFGIREYRPGDSLRRIHWRSSARHGELVVREYEPPGVRMLRIHVDPAPPDAQIADQIARIAASEAWDCTRDGGRVVVSAPGLEPTPVTRDLWTVLEWLARYPAGPTGPSGISGHLLRSGEELVAITAGSEFPEFANRLWVVGDAQIDTNVAFERVGTGWPL